MARPFGIYALGAVLVGCTSTPTTEQSAAPPGEVRPAAEQHGPQGSMDMLPELSGSLPALPANALKVTVRGKEVGVGETEVAKLDDGALTEEGARALQRAMTVAGSPNRPVAIFVDPSIRTHTVVDVVDTAHASGANIVGLVARLGHSVGWIPVRIASLEAGGVPIVRLTTERQNFTELSDEAWARAKGAHRVTVDPDEDMNAQAFYEALHALRGPRCADEPGACRFAALGLAGGPSSAQEGTIGLGNVGLIGKGGGGGAGSGYGRGSGAGFGGNGKRVPRVRQAKATVGDGLDKDIIRRIVRAHINEVRHCYNQGLVRAPDLSGRVAIQFTIGATGKVDQASVDSTTLSDKNVANCIAKAVARWKFPKPRGGVKVNVTYPFVLDPG